MPQSVLGQKRLRRNYGKIREVLEMPNLIEVQKSSYDLFLKSGEGDKPNDGEGLQGVFQSVFPIKDFHETAVLEFLTGARVNLFFVPQLWLTILADAGQYLHR